MTSFNGYSGLKTDDPLRTKIAVEVQKYLDGEILEIDLLGIFTDQIDSIFHLLSTTRQASNTIRSSDITFNKNHFSTPPTVPGLHAGITPISGSPKSKFNTCIDQAGDPDTYDNGGTFYPYGTVVHEAGHALGLSNVSLLAITQPYHVGHPTIPDSVMNYDYSSGTPVIRHPDIKPDFSEPDCEPHPLDIMAIYALYQKIP